MRYGPRRKVRMVILVAGLLLGGVGPVLPHARADGGTRTERPNFVFILVDDMRWDVMSCAGHTFVRTPNIDRIAASGVRFANAFVTTSLCSPSRASFLTGTHPDTHGVRWNGKKVEPGPATPTFPQLLQAAGYQTGYVGKWHMAADSNPRPGFDYWLSFELQGEYIDPELNENGRVFVKKGYMTDILTDYALEFLKKQGDQPFCLYLSHKAMHADFIPAERHKDLYAPSDLIEPPSYRDDLSGKPRWQRERVLRGGRLQRPAPPGGIPDALPVADWDPHSVINQRRLDWHRTLAAVDEGVGAVLDLLAARGWADNTVVIFAGDNGFFLGEHHDLSDKRLAYEESIRVPLLACGPGVEAPGRVVPEMVLNIDVAPTLLELAGVAVPPVMQGRSLRPLFAGERAEWRKSFFYKYFKEDWLPGVPTIEAVRTEQFKYIRSPEIDDIEELYDLKRDPFEMRNLARDPSAQDVLARMRAEMERLRPQTQLPGGAGAGT